MAEVTLQNACKTYPGGFRAVKGFDLRIADGEFVVLVGPSGCGKSTTLRMIAGLEGITDGTIAIGGDVVNEVRASDRDIAMVFQNYALYPHMSVERNLSFGLMRRRSHRSRLRALLSPDYRRKMAEETEAIRQRVGEAARMLGITGMLDRQPRALSGGQRQRVALGRALVRDPRVFLFDEPLSNLDAKLRVEMRTELRVLHRELEATMIYVTHDQEEAMTLGDRLVVMNEGLVQQVDTPTDIYHRPVNRFVAGFVGTPAMNFVEGEVLPDGSFRSGGATLSLGDPFRDVRPGKAVLGVRPSALLPCESGRGWECRIVAVEHLGDRVDLVLEWEGDQFISRVDATREFAEGASLWVEPGSGEGVHLFEADEVGRTLASR
ncbi:MAG: sn-glycerol-3-phosphate ABC transporter ATP-binding protein UgpC [Planctomycetota bacterium]|nr:sn-glycerol-3-phosphate ABC transporter ATP-binding protein UgpC [Planctomycetota bacterium]MED5507821.1 sn-glycerol-3-phosphate ABC transporter ATP-binding protein UgpC [Planctomycetota bacterium]